MQTMTTGMEQAAELHQGFSPLLMQANHILSLSQTELEATILDALDENPALELEDCQVCPVCGRRTTGETCQSCRPGTADTTVSSRADDLPPRSDAEYRPASSADPDFDPMTFIASAMDVRDQILEATLASLAGDAQRAMAYIIIDALDDRGFLTIGLDEIAEQVNAEPEDVEVVLLLIQEMSPPGVAARSLQESLLLQVQFLQREGHPVPASVEAILRDHLDALGAKRFSRIARVLNTTVEEVEAAHAFIRDQLTPHPLQSQESMTWTSPSTGGHIMPDVVVSVDGDGLSIEVPNAIYDRLRTEAFYRSIARPDGNTPATVAADADAVSHARTQVSRAQQFIWAVRQRRQTLMRVAEYVCQYQEAYICGDARALRPLTRSEVANALGVHESTCSRAVSGKFVMLPSRKVIPMSDLFAASLSIKHVIQQIISEEAAAGRALSDAQISDRLLDHGIHIARRTVAKYRNQMHILPSTIR